MAYAVIAAFSGTGATKTTVNIAATNYDIYECPSDAQIDVGTAGDIDYAIIGAGGASSPANYNASGGGSGGDVLIGTMAVSAGTKSITVGLGGTSTTSAATSGGDTSALGLTALGGGYGGGYGAGALIPAINGGGAGSRDDGDSLLGAAHPTSYRGGNAFRVSGGKKHSGGGRGAGGLGGDADADTAGAGGPGIVSDITGLSVEYGAGGTGRIWELNVNIPTNPETPTIPGHGGPGVTSRGYLAGSPGANGVVILRVATPGATTPDEVGGGSIASQVSISGGAVGQTHRLGGSAIASAADATGGALGQTHAIGGGAVAAQVSASGGGLGQTHAMPGGAVSAQATLSGGQLGQTHRIGGGSVTSQVVITGGAIGDISAVPGGSIAAQVAIAGGALGQNHRIGGGSAVAQATVSAGALAQTHALAGGSVAARIDATGGALGQVHRIGGGSIASAFVVSGGAFTQGQVSGRRWARPGETWGSGRVLSGQIGSGIVRGWT
ncbi:hypothetical protein BV509_01110 [Rhodovulum sulfidophilum]|uniref:Glycine-rich domain-containing protein n=1 Tax=Rhodovulum visakhapatnamense TaxID=364297 RepID=A0ABS1RFS9_9RHOB|nr:hypothetical protein [Rhodovulum visakhapatnamense]MBL3569933.1 hypothetical protein [Rhodovulum visakhapatnamense]MBL3578374.1 hypothetical protein [Rhodovulum visakhapatnamense]OLS43085.1 hypothetical protein BV509_01110 [Rhodovulum sulfidophilum]